MKREHFGSRLGFILVSAGCAIGLGNVWKFPYMCGKYGGAAFILIYLAFLLIMGLPIIICEFAVGRGSKKSVAKSFSVLSSGKGWNKIRWIGIVGSYMLMMFYTMVAGWLLYYCFKMVKGDFAGVTTAQVDTTYSSMLGNPGIMTIWTIVVIVLGFLVCLIGLQKGVEKITKVMMTCLLIIMIALAINSVTLTGAEEGIRFYLVPDFAKIKEIGLGNVIFGAMSQAFFTLSIGIGCMAIFGSYLKKERSLTGEAISILVLDTFVALTAGFIIIPACFAYGIEPDAGPGLIFQTLPNVFSQMKGGTIWGALFFLFLFFAAFSTVVAVFENIISFAIETLGFSRKKSILMNFVIITVLSLPAVLGFNVLSSFNPLGEGTVVMDLEDFIVSNNLLPLGSLAYVLFCVRKNGWGWDNFIAEANAGKGIKFPAKIKPYMAFVLPAVVIVIYLKGYYDYFAPQGTKVLAIWMCVAVLFLVFIFTSVFCKPGTNKERQLKVTE
ncbi:MAG: sodium-dependent transporter [Eubacterium sp.]|uniref:sodium-dependent transporter n=1 Tax=Eubacterium sp. TaxID=142586 RepID=UPI003A4474D3